MAGSHASMVATIAAEMDARKARHLQIGHRLDAANAAVRAALAGGDCHEHATRLIERAWAEMLMRDLHGRTTALGRSWEQHMIRDIELAVQMSTDLRRPRTTLTQPTDTSGSSPSVRGKHPSRSQT